MTITTSVPSEVKLLVLCSVNNITEEQQKVILKLIQSTVNWETFYAMVVKNRVYPIVYKNLKKLNTSAVNEQILVRLENDYKKSQFFTLLQAKELIKVMEQLKQQEIQAVSIKGPLLARSIYQDVFLRVSRDLDILVAPSEIHEVEKILLKMGYVQVDNFNHLSLKQKKLLIKTLHHFSYSNDTGVLIELHWRLSSVYYDLSFDEIWRNKRTITMFGKDFNILSDEENLIYLIIHGSRHAWKRLRWLCDIYEIMKNKALDWNYVINRAKELGVIHLVEQTIILLKIFFRYQPQIHLSLTKYERTIANRLAFMSLPFINSLGDETEMYGHPLYKNIKKYSWVWYQGVDMKMQLILSHFIPNTVDFQTIKLQDKYFYLYYVLHFFKISKKCINYLLHNK